MLRDNYNSDDVGQPIIQNNRVPITCLIVCSILPGGLSVAQEECLPTNNAVNTGSKPDNSECVLQCELLDEVAERC